MKETRILGICVSLAKTFTKLALFGALILPIPACERTEDLATKENAARLEYITRNLPENLAPFIRQDPSFVAKVDDARQGLLQACPALREINFNNQWHLANWMNQNISSDEWHQAPLQFRELSYRAISVQRPTVMKTNVLEKLNPTLVDHPNYMRWVNLRTQQYIEQIANDEALRRARIDWPLMSVEQKLQTLRYASGIMMRSFMPQSPFEIPEVNSTLTNANYSGLFVYATRTIAFNFTPKNNPNIDLNVNFDYAMKIATHETMHAIQIDVTHLGQMLEQNKIESPNTESVSVDFIQHAGQRYSLSLYPSLAYVTFEDDAEGYASNPLERLALIVQNSGMFAGLNEEDFNNSLQRMRNFRVYNDDEILAAEKAYQNPASGTMPAQCLK
jgi:hypothetical protein